MLYCALNADEFIQNHSLIINLKVNYFLPSGHLQLSFSQIKLFTHFSQIDSDQHVSQCSIVH